MRKVLSLTAIVLCSTSVAQASTLTLTGRLVPIEDAVNPLLFHIAVQLQSTGTTDGFTESGATDGGVASVQFDIVSVTTGEISPVQQSVSGPNSTKVKTVYALSSADFGTERLPDRKDATPASDPGNHGALYNSDGDLDALGGLLSDSGLGYTNTTVGRNGFQTIATEDWLLTSFNSSGGWKLVLGGPGYYDFGSGHANTNFLVAYSVVNDGPAIIFPEPNGFALAFLAAFGFALLQRFNRGPSIIQRGMLKRNPFA
jgi:hypothetical protein